jgi:exodeoxyribonuclease VII large subunit
MPDPDLFSQDPWTPTQLTRAARRSVEQSIGPIWIRGELTALKVYGSGHWYFTLRDANAQVRCVMWRTHAQRQSIVPEEGSKVFLHGTPTVWEEKAEFKLVVNEFLVTDQLGQKQLALQKLREALAKDGLFDLERKRPLPTMPGRIAVVTSFDGAALRDIVHVARRRWPSIDLLVFGARVQGAEAVREVVRALALVNQYPGIDLCVLARGGGAKEDLAVFNHEKVCRALAAMLMPTISAVGHETDISLTDLIADMRAATPSAAMELALPDVADFRRQVASLGLRLGNALGRGTRLARERLARTGDRLQAVLDHKVERHRHDLARIAAQLDALSPLRVLERGYSVATGANGRVLRQVSDFPDGSAIRLRVSDGEVPMTVTQSRVRG